MSLTINIEKLFDAKYRDVSIPFVIEGTVDPTTTGLITTINAKDYGAAGDGSTDDTAALAAWVAAINASTAGAYAFIPPGQYMTTTGFSITQSGVTVVGAGWAQTASTKGSVISAASGLTGTMVTLAAEGVELRGLTVDGQGRAATQVAVTATNCRLVDMSARGTAANGVTVDVQSGGASIWIQGCRINGINYPNTGIQVADTDAIIIDCKPTNSTYNIVLLSGSDGAMIVDNHMTPGATNGVNCIWVNGNPSHVIIDSNRFDNYVKSGVQITPPSSTPNSIAITNNHFHSTVQTDNTYALIGLDTTASGVRGLHIVGNSGYGSSTHRPKYFVAAQKQDGTAPTNTGRIATLGTLCNSNTAWCNTAFFAADAPTVARGNMTATDGQTYAAVTDI